MIRKVNDKYVPYTKDGKRVLGTHTIKESAQAQERAVEASKHAKG